MKNCFSFCCSREKKKLWKLSQYNKGQFQAPFYVISPWFGRMEFNYQTLSRLTWVDQKNKTTERKNIKKNKVFYFVFCGPQTARKITRFPRFWKAIKLIWVSRTRIYGAEYVYTLDYALFDYSSNINRERESGSCSMQKILLAYHPLQLLLLHSTLTFHNMLAKQTKPCYDDSW